MATFTVINSNPTALPDVRTPVVRPLEVFGLTGITGVSVTLTGLSHTHFDDLSMLLVGPDNLRNLMFMGDAGGPADIAAPGVNITFADTGTAALGDETTVVNGSTYKPSVYGAETAASFGSTVPVINVGGPVGTASFASAFNGASTAGSWRLFIFDDGGIDAGNLNGHSLRITTASSAALITGGAGADSLVIAPTGDLTTGTMTYNGQVAAYSGVSTYTFNLGGGNDTFTGNLEVDVVDGEGGNDVLSGGDGNDLLSGGEGDDTLIGGNGGDTLTGGAGSNAMYGGLGNDLYVVSSATDSAIEEDTTSAGGSDQVQSSASFTLSAGIETLTLTGTAAINGTGSAFANTIIGNSAANILDNGGGDGRDTLRGGGGDDTYIIREGTTASSSPTIDETSAGSGGYDTVISAVALILSSNVEQLILTGTVATYAYGNTLNNVLIGNSIGNTLQGYEGADYMRGLGGNDVYYVDNIGDVVDETAAGSDGSDFVVVSFNYTAPTNVEDVQFASHDQAMRNLTGNTLINALYGNNNNNILDGKAGGDYLSGGYGNDTYIVDNRRDQVVDSNRLGIGGTDTVKSSVSWSLSDTVSTAGIVENLSLTGSGNTTAIGNQVANFLIGNSRKNAMDGMAGADKLQGGAGKDKMTGGSGADDFIFRVAGDSGKTAATRDVITDFRHGQDDIDLSAIDANGSARGNARFSFIAREGADFTHKRGQVIYDRQDAPGARNDKTIVLGDINGDGRADFTIELTGLKVLSAGDFVL